MSAIQDENEVFQKFSQPDFVVYEDMSNQNKQPMIGLIFSTTDNKQYMYSIQLENIDELQTLTSQSLVKTIYERHPFIKESQEMNQKLEKAASEILKTSQIRKSKIPKNEGSAQQPYSLQKK